MNKESFKDPTGCKGTTLSPFWFWNDKIENDRIVEQMELMKSIKIEQPVIHARTGLKSSYLTDEWFDHIAHAVRHAAKRDMKVWLYDEKNWPSGNCDATITRETRYREHFLLIDRIPITKGEPFVIPTNGGDYDSELWEAVFFSEETPEGECLLLDKRATAIRDWAPSCDGELYTVRVAVSHYEPVGKLCVDYMSKEAIRLFTEKTHAQYAAHLSEYFGSTISGIFMDETRFFNALPWTDGFEDEFRARKGYDIHPYLALLLKETERSALIRYDYFDVVSDLLVEATFKTIYDWCDEHQLLSIGHVLGEETLASQSRFNADIMRTYKYMHVPGIDHLGNGVGSLEAKICSSAAHNYGRLNVASESFGAAGWDMSYEDLVTISNWLFQQGVTHIIVHGFSYSIRNSRKDDWPPSYFYQWDHWDQMPVYSLMASRMSYMLQGAVNETDLLVYYPIESFWICYAPDFKIQTCYFKDGPDIHNAQARDMDRDFQLLSTSLLDQNLDFEYLHADAVGNFEIRDGALHNRLTGARYRVLVLPCVSLLPASVVELLNAFMAAGGLVIRMGDGPLTTVDKAGGHMSAPETLPRLDLARMLEVRSCAQAVEACAKACAPLFEIREGTGTLSRTLPHYPPRLHDPYLHDGERQAGVGVTVHARDGERIFNFTNYNRQEEILKVFIRAASEPQVCWPETGETVSPADLAAENEGYSFTLRLPANRPCLVVAAQPGR